MKVYYVRNRTDTDDYGSSVYPRIDYVRYELTQAIPPAYTEWIGAQLLEAVARA